MPRFIFRVLQSSPRAQGLLITLLGLQLAGIPIISYAKVAYINEEQETAAIQAAKAADRINDLVKEQGSNCFDTRCPRYLVEEIILGRKGTLGIKSAASACESTIATQFNTADDLQKYYAQESQTKTSGNVPDLWKCGDGKLDEAEKKTLVSHFVSRTKQLTGANEVYLESLASLNSILADTSDILAGSGCDLMTNPDVRQPCKAYRDAGCTPQGGLDNLAAEAALAYKFVHEAENEIKILDVSTAGGDLNKVREGLQEIIAYFYTTYPWAKGQEFQKVFKPEMANVGLDPKDLTQPDTAREQAYNTNFKSALEAQLKKNREELRKSTQDVTHGSSCLMPSIIVNGSYDKSKCDAMERALARAPVFQMIPQSGTDSSERKKHLEANYLLWNDQCWMKMKGAKNEFNEQAKELGKGVALQGLTGYGTASSVASLFSECDVTLDNAAKKAPINDKKAICPKNDDNYLGPQAQTDWRGCRLAKMQSALMQFLPAAGTRLAMGSTRFLPKRLRDFLERERQVFGAKKGSSGPAGTGEQTPIESRTNKELLNPTREQVEALAKKMAAEGDAGRVKTANEILTQINKNNGKNEPFELTSTEQAALKELHEIGGPNARIYDYTPQQIKAKWDGAREKLSRLSYEQRKALIKNGVLGRYDGSVTVGREVPDRDDVPSAKRQYEEDVLHQERLVHDDVGEIKTALKERVTGPKAGESAVDATKRRAGEEKAVNHHLDSLSEQMKGLNESAQGAAREVAAFKKVASDIQTPAKLRAGPVEFEAGKSIRDSGTVTQRFGTATQDETLRIIVKPIEGGDVEITIRHGNGHVIEKESKFRTHDPRFQKTIEKFADSQQQGRKAVPLSVLDSEFEWNIRRAFREYWLNQGRPLEGALGEPVPFSSRLDSGFTGGLTHVTYHLQEQLRSMKQDFAAHPNDPERLQKVLSGLDFVQKAIRRHTGSKP